MRIEDKVNEIVELSILDVMDLSIEHLSYMFNVYMKKDNVAIIEFKFDKSHEMFKVFCHEVGHMFLHAINQNGMTRSFNQLQEEWRISSQCY